MQLPGSPAMTQVPASHFASAMLESHSEPSQQSRALAASRMASQPVGETLGESPRRAAGAAV